MSQKLNEPKTYNLFYHVNLINRLLSMIIIFIDCARFRLSQTEGFFGLPGGSFWAFRKLLKPSGHLFQASCLINSIDGSALDFDLLFFVGIKFIGNSLEFISLTYMTWIY